MSGSAEMDSGVGPDSGDLDSAVREVIRVLAEQRKGGQAELSRVLGSADNRLNRFVSGERDLKFRELCAVVDALGSEASVFLDLVRLRLRSPEPAEVMRYLGLPNGQVGEPFLIELSQRIDALTVNETSVDPGSHLDELKSLEDLRFAGAAAAQERTEVVCRELAAGLAGPAAERVRYELALGLGLWATIARSTGRKEASASAFALAFELASKTESREVEAILRSRSSYLLIDLGYPRFAVTFINPAAEHFLVTFDRERYGTCLVDRAVALIVQGEDKQAAQALETALDLLPPQEWRYRAAAFHSLSVCAERRQAFGEARALLERAIQEYGSRRTSICGQFFWAQGRHALAEGRLEAASAAFRRASEVLSELGEPFEGELALFDVAAIAVRTGKVTEVRQLGHEFLSKVPKNSHSRAAKETLIGLANKLLWGSLPECEVTIESSREKLKEIGKLFLLPAFKHR